MKIFYNLGIFFLTVFLFGSCSKQFPNQPKPNALPQTRLWLTPESVLHESISRQHVYWYGEDPDGIIVGYLVAVGNFKPSPKQLPSPDSLTYTWTTNSDSLFALPLRVLRDSFTVIVRAVDNTFKSASLLPEGAIIKMMPKPYWDLDTDGVLGGNDVVLNDLLPAADPNGAILLLPIRNTPPTVQFAANPVDSTTYEQPDTTFTVATFSWVGHDLDGDATITDYRIALNDTTLPTNWVTISGSPKFVTLAVPRSVSDNATGSVSATVYTGTYPNLQNRGTISGLKLDATNILYLEAHDIAGEYSKAARMPSDTAKKKWFVKKPKGSTLLIADYDSYIGGIGHADTSVLNSYQRIFTDVGGVLSNFDVLDIGYGFPSANDKYTQSLFQKYGSLVPVNLNPAFIMTLQLYKFVYWFSDLYPSYTPARVGLFYYLQQGGKAIFSTTFPPYNIISFPDVQALNDFAPLDSVSSDPASTVSNPTNADSRIQVGTKVIPYDTTSGYPVLTFGPPPIPGAQFLNFNWRRIYRRADAQYIYRIDSSSTGRYLGSPSIAVINNTKTFVLFAVPVHYLNNDHTALKAFFHKVVVDEFGLQ